MFNQETSQLLESFRIQKLVVIYSLLLLQDVLPSLYWHHYALLVCAVYILLSDRITVAQIDAAEQMLLDF